MPRIVPRLTDDEATFLALVIRVQPATAYQLSKIYSESPVSNFGVSKGKVYPLIRRLKERGLLSASPVGDRRGTDKLKATPHGQEAIRSWIMEVRPNHLLLEDPLRTKVQAFDLLSDREQRQWIEAARAALDEKLDEVRTYARSVTVPYKKQVLDNAVTALRSRIAWLNRVRETLAD